MLRRLFKAVEPFLKSPCELHSYVEGRKFAENRIRACEIPNECHLQGDFKNGSTALNKRRSMTRLLAIYRKNGERYEPNSFYIL